MNRQIPDHGSHIIFGSNVDKIEYIIEETEYNVIAPQGQQKFQISCNTGLSPRKM
ncbi:hypothetical protein [Desulfopila inferna]|uniref:hypothetical protein n=1 Tax=Desulfopila inferna TaxID=468528 RepID=UPI0019636A4E|nr:hypothetical protein [Desulfopila inferna]MBM9605857.1 hypothetical protein [Desulfopila inferna]